jgi:hypothetical protein
VNRTAVAAAISAILALFGLASTASAGNCQARVLNSHNIDQVQGYRCTIVGSEGTNTSECMEFGVFGTSVHFDLADSFLKETLGCTCTDSGTVTKPKFDSSSNAVECAGTGSLFVGKASGKKLTGQSALSSGTSYIYNCVIDPSCTG